MEKVRTILYFHWSCFIIKKQDQWKYSIVLTFSIPFFLSSSYFFPYYLLMTGPQVQLLTRSATKSKSQGIHTSRSRRDASPYIAIFDREQEIRKILAETIQDEHGMKTFEGTSLSKLFTPDGLGTLNRMRSP